MRRNGWSGLRKRNDPLNWAHFPQRQMGELPLSPLPLGGEGRNRQKISGLKSRCVQLYTRPAPNHRCGAPAATEGPPRKATVTEEP
jgi:hypothetical protein